MSWESGLQDGGVSEGFTHTKAAWSFAYNMAACLPSVKLHLTRFSHIYVCVIDNKNSIALHSTPSILPCIWRHYH